MRQSLLTVAALALASFALVSLPSQDAHAGPLGLVIGVEVDGAAGLKSTDKDGNEEDIDSNFGFGGKLRAGYEVIDTTPFKLIPELQLQYTTIASTRNLTGTPDGAELEYSTNYMIGRIGARAGIQFIVGIFAYGHVGTGKASFSSDNETFDDLANEGQEWNLSYDAGLAVNMSLLPILAIGAHGGYNHLSGKDDSTLSWYDFGIHVELQL